MRFASWFAVLILVGLGAGCSNPSSSGCNIMTLTGGCYGAKERCDAATRRCVTAGACTSDLDCADGFACGVSSGLCFRSCYNVFTEGNLDGQCQPGYRCATESTCTRVTAACTPNGKTEECNGVTCDAATKTCTSIKECTTTSMCGNYACPNLGGYCKTSCATHDDCARGSSCDVMSGKCTAITTCDVGTTDCGPGRQCDAATKMCAADVICTDASTCPDGYACNAILKVCNRYCYGAPECTFGYQCPTMNSTCVFIGACTPDGSYSCNGVTCDAATSMCPTTRKACTSPTECAPYTCDSGACKSSCGGNGDCAMGKTCNTMTGACG